MKKTIRLGVIIASILSATTAFGTESGEPAPQFSLPKLADNSPVALNEFSNKVIYLDFWASWCAPCRTSFPILNSLYQKYKNQGFEVVAINLDEDIDAAQKFVDEFPVTFTVLRDADGKWAETYNVESMPTSFIIDKHGVIQLVHNGFSKTDVDALENKVTSLLNQK